MNDTFRKPKVLCILSKVKGGKTITGKLVDAFNDNQSIDPQYLFLEEGDYVNYPSPGFAKFSATLDVSYKIRKKYSEGTYGDYDILIFQSYLLTPPFYKMIRKIPTAVALDTTPSLSHQLILNETKSIPRKLKSKLATRATMPLFKKIFSEVDIFLPRTQWCGDSLMYDFNVSADKIFTTYCPIDLSMWKPIAKKRNELPILLFVGNDFMRKGGIFLLNLYNKYLSNIAFLKIVSNDPYLLRFPVSNDRIEVIRGIKHDNIQKLIEIYQTSDIFLFPTTRDQLGIVLTEAISSGLPVIATDVGGIKEMVIDNYNGYLMDHGSGIEIWAKKITKLIQDSELLDIFGKNSRKLAEKELALGIFNKLISSTIQKLIAKIPRVVQ